MTVRPIPAEGSVIAGALAGMLALIGGVVVVSTPVAAEVESRSVDLARHGPIVEPARFAPVDRRRLAREPNDRVRVLLAGDVGDGAEIAALVRASGGAVSTSDDKAGFVIATLPADQALEFQGTPVLNAMALDRKVREPSTGTDSTDASQAAAAPAAKELFRPYVATGEIGATQFIKDHPTYDGRGVVIAMNDTGVDWTAPGLQTTSRGEGKLTRYYDMRHRAQPSLATDRVMDVSDGRFEVDGDTYTLPPDLVAERVRFGIYSNPGSDVNLDGVVGNDHFGVAVAESANDGRVVFVDTDQDLSFGDEKPLADYNTSHRWASFGVDHTDTPNLIEVRPFLLIECQTEGSGPCADQAEAPGSAWVVFLSHRHATMTAATAAGHDFGPNGEHFDGVAPGAEVWSMNSTGTDSQLWVSEIATSLLVAAQDGADLMNMSFSIAALGPPDPVAMMVDNVAAAYGMLSVTTISNLGPGLQSGNGSPATARTSVSTGASLSSTSLERLFERPGIAGSRIIYYSSHGPELDGHFNPDVVAPTASLAPHPRWQQVGGSGLFQPSTNPALPAAYQIGSGTSNAAPFVSGAAALLISAAKAENLPYTPHTLKRALELSALPLDGGSTYGPEEVGHGLINVPRSYTWLKRLGKEGTIDRDLDTVVASDAFGTGEGIYQTDTVRNVEQVTLITNDAATRSYRLDSDQRWIHLDSERIELPGATGDTPGSALFEVKIDPSIRNQPGVHTGVVTVDDPTTLDPGDHEMLVTIVAPLHFGTDNKLRFSGTGKTGIKAEDYKEFFFRVPAGAQSLQVEIHRPADDPAGVHTGIYRPRFREFSLQSPIVPEPAAGTTEVRTFPNPTPGIWEIAPYAHEMDRQGPVVQRHAYDVTITLTPGA